MSKTKELFLNQIEDFEANHHILSDVEYQEYEEYYLEIERMHRCNEAVDQINYDSEFVS